MAYMGKQSLKRVNIYITDLLYCTPEFNWGILYINYTPIKKLKEINIASIGEDVEKWESLCIVDEVKLKLLSCVRLFATPFSRPEYWSG